MNLNSKHTYDYYGYRVGDHTRCRNGTFNVQWGSEINNSGATLLANTILEITEV